MLRQVRKGKLRWATVGQVRSEAESSIVVWQEGFELG